MTTSSCAWPRCTTSACGGSKMKKIVSVALLGLIGLGDCSEQHPAETAKVDNAATVTPRKEIEVPVDTSASFRIGKYWVTPDSSFEFNTLEKAGSDTLHLVACQKYIVKPFGPVEDKVQLQSGLLRDFSAKTKYIKQENGTYPLVSLSKGNSRLLLYFSTDPEELVYSNILKGEINDSSVVFANSIRVGMRAEQFYKQFFKSFPLILQHQYKTVVFDYCVDGVRHTYDFKNGKLAEVKFSQPGGIWKLDY